MEAEQARMTMQQVQTDGCSPELGPEAQATKTRPCWRGSAKWILACLGGGCMLIAAVLTWGHWEFGSLPCTLAYLNGERILVDPAKLAFGAAHRGEVRDLHVTIRNRRGKEVKILGARSTCGCMVIGQKFPLSIADRGQQELTIRVWLTGKDSAFENRVDFYTDDEGNPVIAVVVRGTITD